MNTKYLVLGLLFIIAASFLLVLQINLTTKKVDKVNMYIFENKQDLESVNNFSISNVSKCPSKNTTYSSNHTCGITMTASYANY